MTLITWGDLKGHFIITAYLSWSGAAQQGWKSMDEGWSERRGAGRVPFVNGRRLKWWSNEGELRINSDAHTWMLCLQRPDWRKWKMIQNEIIPGQDSRAESWHVIKSCFNAIRILHLANT